MSISVNLSDRASLWNEGVNLRLGPLRAVDVALLGAAESLLAGLDATPGTAPTGVSGADRGGVSGQLWASDLPALPADSTAARAVPGKGSVGMPPEDWFESSVPARDLSGVDPIGPDHGMASARTVPAKNAPLAEPIETAGPAQPVQASDANLKAGLRADEGFYTGALEPGRQLNLNQGDSAILRGQLWRADGTAAAMVAAAAPEWHRRDWQRIKLDDQLMREIPLLIGQLPLEPQPAPMRLRFTTVVVDGTLLLAAVVAAVLLPSLHLKPLPDLREMALGVGAALVLLGALYYILFLTVGEATPGMKFAHLVLRTFDDRKTTRAQRWGRLGALLLSLLPAGLGVLSPLFDRNRLGWHDRISRTYVRKD